MRRTALDCSIRSGRAFSLADHAITLELMSSREKAGLLARRIFGPVNPAPAQKHTPLGV